MKILRRLGSDPNVYHRNCTCILCPVLSMHLCVPRFDLNKLYLGDLRANLRNSVQRKWKLREHLNFMKLHISNFVKYLASVAQRATLCKYGKSLVSPTLPNVAATWNFFKVAFWLLQADSDGPAGVTRISIYSNQLWDKSGAPSRILVSVNVPVV